MGHIKEPDGVDFVINSRPLTKEEETAISEYILDYKNKHSKKQIASNKKPKKSGLSLEILQK
jgi:hypothetical protein